MEFFKPRGTLNFMKHRGIIIPVSLFLAFLGIASVFWPGPNYGIDFKGGTEIQLKFGENVSATEVRKTLGEIGYDAEVVNVEGRKGEYLVRVGQVSSLPLDKIEGIKKAINWKIDGVKVDELRVSPGGDKIALRMRDETDPEAIKTALKSAGA